MSAGAGNHDAADAIPPPLAAAAAAGQRFLAAGGNALAWAGIDAALAAAGAAVEPLRAVLQAANGALVHRFLAGHPATDLVADQSALVDRVIRAAWERTCGPQLPDAVLAAVGGYGRAELNPFSDVDLLVLLPGRSKREAREPVSTFLTLLWDIGLQVGHSTRTVDECRDECRRDLTTVTTLMEARWLLGPEALFQRMEAACAPPEVWPARSFFEAKLKEQQARHARYDDTAYNLEPNIKGSPGGLRDIHMVLWVARRHFGTADLEALVAQRFLTPGQLRVLRQGRDFLWRIRFALHALTGRKEDRLLFDYQARIARLFGYQDATYMLAVEQLMQRYYRTVMDLSRLNEMLLQLFQEAILLSPHAEAEPLNERFQVRNGFLQVVGDDIFERQPSAILELFLLLQQNPQVKGVSATTVDLLQRSLHLIDDEFRQDPRSHRLFLQILRAPAGVTHELRRMNLYGVLGRYVPSFGRIVGRMQYDLFHAYTVDAHTLFVVSNLRRFALSRYDHEFPRCSEIMQALPAPEIAYLAGLFHDIAKGRGGDHSELGAVDAESFCLEHGLSRYEARLTAWLVRYHLRLSMTAQRRDIADPEVIAEFAAQVGDETHLDYLYLLTVADVRATNPKLWNSWKAQLFEELYAATRHALRRGLETPIDKDELLAERRAAALALLETTGLDRGTVERVWALLTEDYFLRCRPETIAWHTRGLARFEPDRQRALVDVHDDPGSGGTEIFLYTPQEQHSFALATGVLDELGFTIADARIIPLDNGYSLSTYVVLEQSGERITDPARHEQIRRHLDRALARTDGTPARVTRRAPRQVRMFAIPTLVSFALDEKKGHTVIELVAGDRPGLLCEVGKVLRDKHVAIHTAKIVTLGERAEDVFYVTDQAGRPLAAEFCEDLQRALTSALDQAA
ncbi:MAG: [protein-PII] uridylyltransferase [Gammaproteobacteria bacterium]|nr:[protein-PII] uridylyltransferase [Gammaproteobacteria bacterium]